MKIIVNIFIITLLCYILGCVRNGGTKQSKEIKVSFKEKQTISPDHLVFLNLVQKERSKDTNSFNQPLDSPFTLEGYTFKNGDIINLNTEKIIDVFLHGNSSLVDKDRKVRVCGWFCAGKSYVPCGNGPYEEPGCSCTTRICWLEP